MSGKLAAGILFSCVAVMLTSHASAGISFSFINVADSTGGLSGFGNGNSAINAGGTVAFYANRDAGGAAIFVRSTGGVTTSVADASTGFSNFGTSPVVNVGGDVAFLGDTTSGASGIYKTAGGAIVTIGDTTTEDGRFSAFTNSPSINSAGVVAFGARWTSTTLASGLFNGIYRGSGGALTAVADASNGFNNVSSVPTLTDDGLCVFGGRTTTNLRGIFAAGASGFITMADTSGPFSAFGSVPAVNQNGQAAFEATLDSGATGIFVGDGTSTRTIADTDGPFASFVDTAGPSINSAGLVTFIASLDSGETGLFDGPDPVADRIIATSDTLFGSTVVALSAGRSALNDSGDFTFRYTLANGVSGIALTHVPEPAALAPLSWASCAFGGRRRRRRDVG